MHTRRNKLISSYFKNYVNICIKGTYYEVNIGIYYYERDIDGTSKSRRIKVSSNREARKL